MSSTTRRTAIRPSTARSRRDRQRGQVLVLFVGGLIGFLAVAALVFDVGQNLFDWRTQRDAADASALAGSRYIADPRDPSCAGSPSVPNCPTATEAALRVAKLNGFGDGSANCTPPSSGRGQVCVHIPPITGDYSGQDGFVQVDIHTDRPSFFAAVLGMLRQNVDALAVAGNSGTVAPPYSMLALNEDCDPNPSGQVGGNGSTTVDGAILVNSNCNGALLVNGNGALTGKECGVVGTIQVSGSNAVLKCPTPPFDGTGDPLLGIGPGANPGTPSAVEILSWNGSGAPKIPQGCPGSTVDINFVGAAYAALDSVTLPGFAIGDMAMVYAYNATGTPPSLPAGWTNIQSGNNDGNSSRVGYRLLDGTEITTGNWTGANAVEVIIVRGQDTDTPIGDHQSGGNAGATMTTPGLTMTPTPTTTSWVVAFAGAANGANLTTLSGTTARNGAIPNLALHTGEAVASWASRNYAGAVTGPNRTDAVEVLANPAPSTAANPVGCTLGGGSGQKWNVFRIHPGVYYGGLSVKSRARVYMAPGPYWLAGGGLTINAKDAQLVSVDGAASTNPGRGVFLYDTEDAFYHNECIAGTAPANACIGDIHVNGTSSGDCTSPVQPVPPAFLQPTQPCQWIHLEPASSPTVPITNLLLYVDRNFTGVDVIFNGGAGKLELKGTLYDPFGQVTINGGAADTVSAQIIAYTFKITGNGGFHVTYEADGVIQLDAAGLVQ